MADTTTAPPEGQPPAGTGTPPAGGNLPPAAPQGGDRGYPADTPVAEMEPAQQAAYWKQQARKHESEAKRRADYDTLKERASQYDTLLATTQTDQERAVTKARKEGADEARAATAKEYGAQLVAARLHSAMAGRVTDEQLAGLVEGVDPGRFLTTAGAVDEDRITAWVDRVAPARTADLGQGPRGAAPAGSDMNALIRGAVRNRR